MVEHVELVDQAGVVRARSPGVPERPLGERRPTPLGPDLAGAAAAVAVPMAALTALRVLDHASDFTRPAEPAPEVDAEGVGAA